MFINYFADKVRFSTEIRSKSYANQEKSLSDLQLSIKHSFLLNFLHELLMISQVLLYTVALVHRNIA